MTIAITGAAVAGDTDFPYEAGSRLVQAGDDVSVADGGSLRIVDTDITLDFLTLASALAAPTAEATFENAGVHFVGTTSGFYQTGGIFNLRNCRVYINLPRFGAAFPAKTGGGLSGDFSNTRFIALAAQVAFNLGAEDFARGIDLTGASFEGNLAIQLAPGFRLINASFTNSASSGRHLRIVNLTSSAPADRHTTWNLIWGCDIAGWGEANGGLNVNLTSTPDPYHHQVWLVGGQVPSSLRLTTQGTSTATKYLAGYRARAWRPRVLDLASALDPTARLLPAAGQVLYTLPSTFDHSSPPAELSGQAVAIPSTGLLVLARIASTADSAIANLDTSLPAQPFHLDSLALSCFDSQGDRVVLQAEDNSPSGTGLDFSASHDITRPAEPLLGGAAMTPAEATALLATTSIQTLDSLARRAVAANYRDANTSAGEAKLRRCFRADGDVLEIIGAGDDTTEATLSSLSPEDHFRVGHAQKVPVVGLGTDGMLAGSTFHILRLAGELDLSEEVRLLHSVEGGTLKFPKQDPDNTSASIDGVFGEISVGSSTRPTTILLTAGASYTIRNADLRNAVFTPNAGADITLRAYGSTQMPSLPTGYILVREFTINVSNCDNRCVAIRAPGAAALLYYQTETPSGIHTFTMLSSEAESIEVISRRAGYAEWSSGVINLTESVVTTLSFVSTNRQLLTGGGAPLYENTASSLPAAPIFVPSHVEGESYIQMPAASATRPLGLQEIYDACQDYSCTMQGLNYTTPALFAELANGVRELLLNWTLGFLGSSTVGQLAGGTVGAFDPTIQAIVQNQTIDGSTYGDTQFEAGTGASEVAAAVAALLTPRLDSLDSAVAAGGSGLTASQAAAIGRLGQVLPEDLVFTEAAMANARGSGSGVVGSLNIGLLREDIQEASTGLPLAGAAVQVLTLGGDQAQLYGSITAEGSLVEETDPIAVPEDGSLAYFVEPGLYRLSVAGGEDKLVQVSALSAIPSGGASA